MSDVYSFRQGPTYRGADRQEMFDAALEQPLSITSTLLDQAKGGILESFGLGTAIRNTTLPEAAPVEPGITTDPGDRNFLHGRWETPDELAARRESMGALDENQYKASPYYRENVPYDPGMTEARAAALAAADDARTVRQHYASKRPISAFIGNLGGQALDPINYIPVAGPAVRAAAVSRFGRFAGDVATAAADAAANTAIFGIGTAGERAKFGDDVSWQSTVSQIATAALIGSAFGAIGGAVGSRLDARRVAEAELRLGTLRTTQEARIALNEGIDALVRGEDIRLSPNSTEPMARIASEMGPDDFRRWSAGTKLVDENGNPLVLYHQTAPENVASIEKTGFDLNRIGARGSDEGMPDGVFLKTTDENIGVGSADKASQMEVYAAIRNPLVVVDREALAKVLEKDAVYADLKRQADELDKRLAKEYDDTYNRLDEAAKAEGKRSVGKSDEIDALFERGNAELREAAGKARARATEILKENGYDGVVMEKDAGSFGRSVRTIIAFSPDQTRLRTRTASSIDTTAARPDPAPEGVKQAEAAIAKPDDAKALADQYRVDPQTGSFAEEAEVAQLAAEGRLTETDVNTMAQAQADFETGDAYAAALKAVSSCLL